jgi:hypothetical protein
VQSHAADGHFFSSWRSRWSSQRLPLLRHAHCGIASLVEGAGGAGRWSGKKPRDARWNPGSPHRSEIGRARPLIATKGGETPTKTRSTCLGWNWPLAAAWVWAVGLESTTPSQGADSQSRRLGQFRHARPHAEVVFVQSLLDWMSRAYPAASRHVFGTRRRGRIRRASRCQISSRSRATPEARLSPSTSRLPRSTGTPAPNPLMPQVSGVNHVSSDRPFGLRTYSRLLTKPGGSGSASSSNGLAIPKLAQNMLVCREFGRCAYEMSTE